MTKVSDILKQRQKELKVDPADIAKACGVSTPTVYKWLNGNIEEIGSTKIKALADILKISPSVIIGDLDEEEETLYKFRGKTRLIPIYDNICCGDGLFVDDSIIDYVSVPVTMLHNKSANYFAQYASGDSMTGVSINDSDLLIFRKSDTIDSGKIGCFLVGEKAYCKKFMQQDNQIYLMPANENYLPIKIDESTEGFRIVGTLALVLKKY